MTEEILVEEESPIVTHMDENNPLSEGIKSSDLQEHAAFMEEAFNNAGMIQETKTAYSEVVPKLE